MPRCRQAMDSPEQQEDEGEGSQPWGESRAARPTARSRPARCPSVLGSRSTERPRSRRSRARTKRIEGTARAARRPHRPRVGPRLQPAASPMAGATAPTATAPASSGTRSRLRRRASYASWTSPKGRGCRQHRPEAEVSLCHCDSERGHGSHAVRAGDPFGEQCPCRPAAAPPVDERELERMARQEGQDCRHRQSGPRARRRDQQAQDDGLEEEPPAAVLDGEGEGPEARRRRRSQRGCRRFRGAQMSARRRRRTASDTGRTSQTSSDEPRRRRRSPGPRVKRRKAREAGPKAALPSIASRVPVRTASTGFTRTPTIKTRDAAPDGRSEARPSAATSKRTTATNHTTSARARARARRSPAERAAANAEKDRGEDERGQHEQQETAHAFVAGAVEDHEAGGAEPQGFRPRQGGEEPQQLAEQDGPARHRLGEEQLRRPPVRAEGEDTDEERGQRHEQEHELDERDRGAGEVLDPAPAREDVAGSRHGEGEGREDHREGLGPTRANRQRQLLPRAEHEGVHGAPPGAGPVKTSVARRAVPAFASGSASREAASAWATRCEPIGVSSPGTLV